MKRSVRKPGPAKKTAGTVRPRSKGRAGKKKKRKKPDSRDRVRAVLVVAVLILAAAVSYLALMYFHSVKTRSGAASQSTTAQAPVPVEAPPVEKAQPSARPAPEAPGIATVLPEASAPVVSAPAVSAPEAGTRPAEDRTLPPAALPTAALPTAALPTAALPPAGIIERPEPSRGVLAFVIDDAGNNLRDLKPFLEFPGPLTIAVLPGLHYSVEAARLIRAAGKELFLHQPMEALGGQNPGPGAILAGMDRDEIRAIVNRNLDELWPVAGINNHEGSRITMNEDAMETILALCRERGISFLDSKTTADSAAPRIARRLGMSIGERDVFVDNIQEKESMIGYINTGLARAEQNGSAIMIGHVWSPVLAPLLAEMLPDLEERGYSFSPASALIGGTE